MKRILLIFIILATLLLNGCTISTTTATITHAITSTVTVTHTITPTVTAANLKEEEADFIVISAISSNPNFPNAGFKFQTEFNSLYRQWHVTILTTTNSGWGHVYLVDDTTGKVINLP